MKRALLASLVLVPALALAVNEPKPSRGKLEGVQSLLTKLDGFIFGGMDNAGLSLRSLGDRNQMSWGALRKTVNKEIEKSQCKSLACANYEEDLAELSNSHLARAEKAEWLFNGPNSFARREQLVKNAEKSIHMLVWGYYDDVTGRVFGDWLLSRLAEKPDLDIRLVVDEQTAILDGHWAELERLEKKSEGKIKVLRWRTSRYRANGMHRKLMIVDGYHAIAGGLNIGDYYSHMGDAPKWRDTDLYFAGEQSGAVATNQFISVWNEQIVENKAVQALGKMDEVAVPSSDASIRLALTDHNPGNKLREADHNIVTAITKLINDAQNSIDIENAYFIFDKVLEDSIKKALARGVKIRMLTNSDESVDEPIVSVPIMASAVKAAQMGVETYLKRGATLHSKFLAVDGKIAMVGSQNLHPRSQYFEGENTVTVFDETVAKNLIAQFEQDIAVARKIEDPKDVKVKRTFKSRLVDLLFFEHL